MIQDIGTHCYHNEYIPVPPKEQDFILCYKEKNVLVKKTKDSFLLPRFCDIPNWETEPYIYLFSIDEHHFYMLPKMQPSLLSDFTFEDLVIFRSQQPKELCFALITGFHLFSWYENRKFCGKCGEKLLPDTKERMMYCPHCHNTEYPKISPAVIVGIRNKNKLLLSKYAGRNTTRYALIAGFTEIGETLEDTVRREIMEEVGLKVKNIQYYKSQPWGLSGSVLSGFFCDLDGDDTITLDREELSTAQWFEREDIPYDDYDVSLTREMMIQFKKGLY